MKRIGSKHAGTDDRKKEIIRAALECFTKTGTESTSISDICRKAGASTGSIYHHFGSKENLASAVYLEGIARYQKGYVEALESSADARTVIFGIIAYHLGWVEENIMWANFLVRERHAPFMGGSEDNLSRLNMDFIQEVGAWFRENVAKGTIKRLTPELYMAILMGPVQEYVRIHILSGRAINLKTASEELGNAAWCALKSI